MTRSRGDALQLGGINTTTGAAASIGIPRDSWVSIPDHGMNKINAALYFGGPRGMAGAMRNLVGITPDYVRGMTAAGYTPALGHAGLSGFYDLAIALWTRERRWRSAFLDQIAPQGADVVVDVGCCTGALTALIKAKAPAAAVTGDRSRPGHPRPRPGQGGGARPGHRLRARVRRRHGHAGRTRQGRQGGLEPGVPPGAPGRQAQRPGGDVRRLAARGRASHRAKGYAVDGS